MRQEHKDISFEIPRDWTDKSIVAYAAPPRPGQSTVANVVLTRDTLQAGETVRSYADRQLTELAKRLDSFALTERKESTIGAVPAIEVHFTWRGSSGPLVQRLVMLAKRKTVMSFTATASKAEASALGPVFDRIFQSVKLAGEES